MWSPYPAFCGPCGKGKVAQLISGRFCCVPSTQGMLWLSCPVVHAFCHCVAKGKIALEDDDAPRPPKDPPPVKANANPEGAAPKHTAAALPATQQVSVLFVSVLCTSLQVILCFGLLNHDPFWA